MGGTISDYINFHSLVVEFQRLSETSVLKSPNPTLFQWDRIWVAYRNPYSADPYKQR